MTVHNYFTCDYCNTPMNPEADDGTAVTVGHERPERWFEVPGKGPNGTVGHACPECVAINGEAQRDIADRRDAALNTVAANLGTSVQTSAPIGGAGDGPNG